MSAKLWKSKKYPNLFRDESSGIWQFRKYSSEKGKEYNRSTGEKESEARAYRLGLDSFNEWLGKLQDDHGIVYFAKIAKRFLNQYLDDPSVSAGSKETLKNCFLASTQPRIGSRPRPRLLDAFGHLPIERINNEVWMAWVKEMIETYGEFKFFNSRKALLQVLHHAYNCRHLDRVPTLDNPDGEAAPPRELSRDELRVLFRSAHYVQLVRGPSGTTVRKLKETRSGQVPVRVRNWIKLFMFINWKQGPRPGETLQYEWSMIHFDEGGTVRRLKPGEEPIPGEPRVGRIHIPGKITKTRRARVIDLNRKVSRVLKFLRPHMEPHSRFLFPSPDDREKPMVNFQKTWRGLCRRAGFEAQMYWFRDTFVTIKLRAGKQALTIARYIDSSVKMLERRYAVSSSEDFQKVAE